MSRKTYSSSYTVDLQGVSIRRYENEVLHNVDLQLSPGDFVYITGPVGSGKSTLLELLYGELPPHEGVAYVLGENLHHINARQRQALRRRMGIVFQSRNQLLYDRNVEKNLDFVLRATTKLSKSERNARITSALEAVGMAGKGYRLPHELSGGEAERICIARALVVHPDLIVLDEPTSGLDSATSLAIGKLILSLASQGTTVVMSTHNEQLVKELPARTYKVCPQLRKLLLVDPELVDVDAPCCTNQEAHISTSKEEA